MTLEMLSAYYSSNSNSADLFKGLNIERDETFQKHLNHYDVIYLNMQQFLIRAKKQEVTQYLKQAVMEELRELYGEYFSDMFREYSMTDQKMFEEYTGFTETEVKALCRQYDMDFDETNSWYDGYRLRTFRRDCACRN